MSILLSVIIPVYNVSEYIDRMVSSIVNQTYKNLEIIIIDDGSTDDTMQKCISWREKDDRIKIFFQENSGQSVARNLGLKKAKGTYIYFADSDDYIDANYFEHVLKRAKGDEDLLVSSYVVERNEKVDYFNNDYKKVSNLDIRYIIDQVLMSDNAVSGFLFNKFFNKKKLNEDILFDENIFYSEDTLFLVRFLNKCNKVLLVDSPYYYHYLIRIGSTTISSFSTRKLSIIQANEKLLAEVSSIKSKEIIQGRLNRSYFILLINLIESKEFKNEQIEKELVNKIKMDYKVIISNPYTSNKNKIAASLIKISYPIFKLTTFYFHKKKF